MKSSIDFLNKAMETHSGYQLVKILGLSGTGVVSMWKKRGHVSPYYAAKLAELTGDDPREAIAIAGAEAEPDEEKRSYLLKKLGGVAAAAAIISVNLFLTHAEGHASMKTPENSLRTLYIMSNRMLSRLLALLRAVKATGPGTPLPAAS